MRLDTWDTTATVRYDQQLFNELISLRFTEAAHGALILGPVGVGKTHLASTLGHIAVRRRLSVHMTRAGQLFKHLKAARLDNTTEAEHRRLAATDILILDDFALTPLDDTATTDFYELIVNRHRKKTTIVTSNRTPDEWVTLMNDPLLAQSAVDDQAAGQCPLFTGVGKVGCERARPMGDAVEGDREGGGLARGGLGRRGLAEGSGGCGVPVGRGAARAPGVGRHGPTGNRKR